MADPTSLPGVETLQDLVSSFEAHGDAAAIIAFRQDRVEKVGAAELVRRSRRLAAGMVGRGLKEQRPVALFGPNSVDWVACRFALILADALCVPVDYDADAARLRDLLAHSGARELFVAPAFLDVAREAMDLLGEQVEIVLIDAGGFEEEGERMTRLADLESDAEVDLPRAAPDSPVAKFYTAGTTGAPKAVPLTHANILTNLRILIDLKVARPGDRIALPLPLHHSYPFIVGLLLPQSVGATTVFPAGLRGPELVQALREGEADILVGVPRLYEALVGALDRRIASLGAFQGTVLHTLVNLSQFARRRLGWRVGRTLLRPLHKQIGPKLRVMACGGAKLDAEVEWRLEGLGYALLTGYGLVETTSIATYNPPGQTCVGSAGRPSPVVEMRIVPVEGMEHGEVQFRGPIVFNGYADNPEANAEAFTDGWFRTGDLGWKDDRGFLFISGRLKEVIVMPGGKNVAPGDVEAVYSQSPYVEEMAVMEREGRLVGLAVPDMTALKEAGIGDIEQQLRISFGELGRKLPRYMRLSDFVVTREPLPRNQLGKYKRHQLGPIYDRAERGEAPAPGELSPDDERRVATERGQAVMDWLEGRFPDKHVHPDTSLQMDLGIDSLAWVDLSMELEERTGASLSEDAIAELVTVRDLLDAVEQAEAGDGAAEERRARASSRLTDDRERWLSEPGPLGRAFGLGLLGFARTVSTLLLRLKVEGRDRLPDKGPLIIAANHLSDLDPMVLGAALPSRTYRNAWWSADAKRVFGRWVTRQLARSGRVFPVDNRALDASLGLAAETIERGRILIWFPEEWRSATGELQRFRAGIGALIDRTGADVLPAVITGTFEAMPRTASMPRAGRVSVRFGDVIPARDLMPAEPIDEAHDRHRAIARALQERYASFQANGAAATRDEDAAKAA